MAMYVLTYLKILPTFSRVEKEIGRGRKLEFTAYGGT